MITNERQRRVAAGEKKRFEQAIARARAEGPGADVHPVLHDAMIEGMDSQLTDLNAELGAYDALKAGHVKGRVFHSIGELPSALIEGRIAAGLTQKALAERIGVSEQQVQRYEQTRYSAASLERLQSVAEALKLTVRESIGYHLATGAVGRRAVRPNRKTTGKKTASAAGKTRRAKGSSRAAKTVAASDLSQGVRSKKH